MRDFRYAFRSLVRSKAVAATAILSLALGIGANTAVFSLVNAILLRPLPVPHPSQLVELYTIGAEGRNRQSFSWPMFGQIHATQQVFSGVFTWFDGALENFEANGVKYADALDGVSGEYFSTLGVQPLLGRLITPEDVASSAQVAVLSYPRWQERYAGDRGVIGKSITIAARPMTIIGVTPKSFAGLSVDYGFGAAVPISWGGFARLNDRKARAYNIMGRLKAGVSIKQARAAMQTLWPSIQAATVPPGQQSAVFFARRMDLDSASAGNSYFRDRQSHSLLLIMSLVGAVLLIACVNLANLMLARAAVKERETGIRIALGAGRWQLARRWIAESLLLSSAGGALGLLAAFWTTPLLLKLNNGGFVPYAVDARPDLRVLAFTLALTVATALLFGLAPVWRASAANPAEALQRGSTRVHGQPRLGARTLVSAQIAVSIVLVTSAGLLVRSLENMRTADLGFRRDHLLTMQLFPQAGSGRIPDRTVYYRELSEKLRGLPGVQAVSYSNAGPVSRAEYPYTIASPLSAGPSSSTEAMLEVAGPGFFELVGMHVLTGRGFDWHDDLTGPAVCEISESLARDLFPDQNPIGRVLDVPEFPAKGLRVIGVVNNASLWLVRHREPKAVYLPFLQQPAYNQPLLTMRTAGDPLRFATDAERVLASLGHHYSIRTQSVEQRADLFLAEDRTIVILCASFAVLALLLAGVGLYGVVSHAVARRIAEIGIRMAVGANRADVLRLIMRDVLWLVVAGLAVGVPATLLTRRMIVSLLFGVGASDPPTLAVSFALLIGVAALAGFLPARRAMRVDPMTALRAE
jgi:putative ABC transport system permease protein